MISRTLQIRPLGGDSGVRAQGAGEVFEAHAEFVWAQLQRFGLRGTDLEDATQEVFVVVHRKLHTFDGTSKITTWLFAIALRVARSYRRRAWFRREQPCEEPISAHEEDTPEDACERAEGRRRLQRILDSMPIERRSVFVMFELEEMSCEAIGEFMNLPVGTVHSRLFKARQDFAERLAKENRRDLLAAAKVFP